MSYQEQSDQYRGAERNRYDACVREQGLIFSADGRPDIAALGKSVVTGDLSHIDAVIASVCFGPSWSELDEDDALRGAVQSQWPTVAAALFPQPT